MVEAPHFFFCREHYSKVRAKFPAPAPNPKRDAGLCIKPECGSLAEPARDVVLMDTVSCIEAERQGVTVARLSTRKFCALHDPYANPMCQNGKHVGKRQRALPADCCGAVKSGRNRPHCQSCHDRIAAAYKARGERARLNRPARPMPKGTNCHVKVCRHERPVEAVPCFHWQGRRGKHCQKAHERESEYQRRYNAKYRKSLKNE